MRQVLLDTETTGLDPAQGHRIIEIGCVELVGRRLTQRVFHQYLQPDREIDAGAEEVHGISAEFLKDKPHFGDVVDEFLDFIRDAEVVIHNAPFDVGFIDKELSLLGGKRGCFEQYCSVLDTLTLARKMHPGQKNNLDALCKRYMVDNSQRERHGALLDAEILADVYVAMTGGQVAFKLGLQSPVSGEQSLSMESARAARGPLKVLRADATELSAHADRLQAIDEASDGECLWKRLES